MLKSLFLCTGNSCRSQMAEAWARHLKSERIEAYSAGVEPQGLNSVAFGLAAILAMVVMYDAAGVRQAVSRQSIILNRIVEELRLRRPRGEVERDLRELVGHTPYQVIIGSLMGIIIAWIWLLVS